MVCLWKQAPSTSRSTLLGTLRNRNDGRWPVLKFLDFFSCWVINEKKKSIAKLGKHWASQIGSFDKNHILNHKNKRFDIKEDDIETIQIEFITFDDLIQKYSIKSIDKLQIDVEGAEYKIMNSINFQKIEINKILFESKHFDGTFIEGKKLQEIEEKLKSNGYKLQQIDKENILASK